MKTHKSILVILALCLNIVMIKAENLKRNPINYTIILDLSDRVLNESQLNYDFEQIKLLFLDFKQKAKQNLIITSKDRFVVKIVPQKGSPLNIDIYENALQLRLDQISIKDKNNLLNELDKNLSIILDKLKKEALYGSQNAEYSGVDLWAFLYNNKNNLTYEGYDNKILIMTDGYLDFENNSHVMKVDNHYTSTAFISKLNGNNWEEEAKAMDYGILPITIKSKATWIISGVRSKNQNDIMQMDKLKYFWSKWIIASTQTTPLFIHYSTESQILSELKSIIN